MNYNNPFENFLDTISLVRDLRIFASSLPSSFALPSQDDILQEARRFHDAYLNTVVADSAGKNQTDLANAGHGFNVEYRLTQSSTVTGISKDIECKLDVIIACQPLAGFRDAITYLIPWGHGDEPRNYCFELRMQQQGYKTFSPHNLVELAMKQDNKARMERKGTLYGL